MKIQARSVLADIPRKLFAAGGQSHRLGNDIDYLPRHAPAAVRPEVFRTVLSRLVCYIKFRVLRIDIKPYEWIALVILQKYIVMRLMLLYQRIFENQRLKLGIYDYDIEVGNLLDHCRHLGQVGAAEVARHSVFEFFCLTYIYNFPR